MDFLRKLFGDKQTSIGDKQTSIGDKQPSTCNFTGKVVPVTMNVDEFIRIARADKKPIGLFVKIKDWMLIHGQLLSSTTGGTLRSNPFYISSSGPCYVICAQCNVELNPATIAMLGSDSVMSAFGVAPVDQCPGCGSTNVIIVSAKKT